MSKDNASRIRAIVPTDERGVSPVIGVILMVAITVILAAVIATFVLGLGEQVSDTAPQASFSCSGSSGDWDITMDGGQSLDPANVQVDGTDWNSITEADSVSEITAGDGLTGYDGGSGVITWSSDDGSSSATLFDGCEA